MVKVKVEKINDSIKFIDINGHADYGQYGNDLVCAAVSSISIGLLNAIDILAPQKCDIQLSENRIRIMVLNNEEVVQTVLSVGLIQLKTIEEKYPKNLKIELTEV
ncbi:MAG: ribosomal-processing cysteine protease Prp [Erysipelotrichia bacterium]|nr:ribosomal-processing cysteine protease Prp [Erysipelotrichia bacterium]